jgi:hypothetical protein
MLITESLNSFGRWQNQSSSNSISTRALDSSVFHLLKLNFTTNPHLQDDTKVKSAFLQKTKFDSHAQQQHTNMQMSEKCLLVCCRKAATNGFTHAAISLGPLVRITISTGLLLTASSSSATLPFLVHPLLQPSGLQTQKQKQCAIKLYSCVSCMHHS